VNWWESKETIDVIAKELRDPRSALSIIREWIKRERQAHEPLALNVGDTDYLKGKVGAFDTILNLLISAEQVDTEKLPDGEKA